MKARRPRVGRPAVADVRARPLQKQTLALHRAHGAGLRLRLLDRSAETGSPRTLYVTRAPHWRGEAAAIAARHLDHLGRALTSTPGFRPQFVTDGRVGQSHGGLQVVHFQQVHLGIPIEGMTRTVRLGASGRLHSIVGDSLAFRTTPSITPMLDARRAAGLAAAAVLESGDGALGEAARRAVAEIADGSAIARVASPASGGQATMLRGAKLGASADVRLVFHPVGRKLELCWEVRIVDRGGENHFAVGVVAAGPRRGRIAGIHDHALGLTTQAWVHRLRPGGDSPVRVQLPDIELGMPWTLRGGTDPLKSLWVESRESRGRFVESVVYEVNSDESATVVAGGDDETQLFDERTNDRRQGAVQLLYFCSWLHDFFERLGFGPLAGSLEVDSGGGDPLLARVRDVPNVRRAWLVPAPDGGTCVLFTGPDPQTGKINALDADTVFHEYTHAVTQRVVGGPGNVNVLSKPQSAGLAEGWSDYFALTLQNVRSDVEKTTIGEWTSGLAGGARSHAYDADFASHARYGSLGQPGWREPHEVGEVWAATLMQAQRELVVAFPGEKDWCYALLWQVVFDSLVKLPENPSFVQAREAMFTALGQFNGSVLTQARFDTARAALWKAFAAFGLGVNARFKDAGFKGIVEDRRSPA